jgi:hypothetical protein
MHGQWCEHENDDSNTVVIHYRGRVLLDIVYDCVCNVVPQAECVCFFLRKESLSSCDPWIPKVLERSEQQWIFL